MKDRLLVVDDDVSMVKTLSDLFRLRGWEVASAHSGEEAVSAVHRQRYAAVLMDIKMQGISGVEALRRIRRERPEQRVILMTAYTAHDQIELALREGALRVIPKPVPIPELLRWLEELRSCDGPVLLVDDDAAFLHTLAHVLRASGYRIEEAATLEQAVAHAVEDGPCVIALDLRLGDARPAESVAAIRAANTSAALVLFSGHPALLDETAGAFPPQWIHARLQKPFSPERLLEILNDVC